MSEINIDHPHGDPLHPDAIAPGPLGRHDPVVPSDSASLAAAGELLRALAAPARIAIVLSLQQQGKCVHELVGELGFSQPLVSQHLRVLKDAGVVRGQRNGREIMYELVDDHLAHIVNDAVLHASERDHGHDDA